MHLEAAPQAQPSSAQQARRVRQRQARTESARQARFGRRNRHDGGTTGTQGGNDRHAKCGSNRHAQCGNDRHARDQELNGFYQHLVLSGGTKGFATSGQQARMVGTTGTTCGSHRHAPCGSKRHALRMAAQKASAPVSPTGRTGPARKAATIIYIDIIFSPYLPRSQPRLQNGGITGSPGAAATGTHRAAAKGTPKIGIISLS